MATNIVRLTLYEASAEQLAELRRIFGDDVEVTMVSERLSDNDNVWEAVDRFDEIAADAQVVEATLLMTHLDAVLKYSVFCKRGGQIIQVVWRDPHGERDPAINFLCYERVLGVRIVTETLP